MLAVLTFTEFAWNQLPDSYRNSPVFNLDQDIFEARPPNVPHINNATVTSVTQLSESRTMTHPLIEVPINVPSLRVKNLVAMRKLKNFLFLCTDAKILENTLCNLKEITDDLEALLPSQEGLHTIPSLSIKKTNRKKLNRLKKIKHHRKTKKNKGEGYSHFTLDASNVISLSSPNSH
jgi:hypothetical protein